MIGTSLIGATVVGGGMQFVAIPTTEAGAAPGLYEHRNVLPSDDDEILMVIMAFMEMRD